MWIYEPLKMIRFRCGDALFRITIPGLCIITSHAGPLILILLHEYGFSVKLLLSISFGFVELVFECNFF